MPVLDHLVLAGPDLDAGIAHVSSLTGAEATFGGPHPGVGTRNALLTFDEETYFEVIAVDPDQSAPARPRPFGIDDMAADATPRLGGFAIHPAANESIDEVADRLRSAGFDPGPVVSMSRVRPDGVELSWRLTRSGGIPDSPGGSDADPIDGVLPFVIDWGDTASPATSSTRMGRLVTLRIAHPDGAVWAALEGLALDRVEVSDGPRSLVAVVETASGAMVEIS